MEFSTNDDLSLPHRTLVDSQQNPKDFIKKWHVILYFYSFFLNSFFVSGKKDNAQF